MPWLGLRRHTVVGEAKQILVKPISAQDANRIVRAIHYSHKVVNNSQVHLGVFLGERCGGAMQFGPSLDKRKMLGLVEGTLWNEFLELNRLAFADWLPRNSESRAIGYAMRWLRKTYPWLKWVVSFADATQCGDGTIYRASGFVLTGIKKNTQIWQAPTVEIFCDTSIRPGIGGERERAVSILNRITTTKGKHILNSGASSMRAFKEAGWKPKAGFQLRYLYFLDPSARGKLTVSILPFSEIERQGAGMYRGHPKRGQSDTSDTSGNQPEKGGATPTCPLPDLQPRLLPEGETEARK